MNIYEKNTIHFLKKYGYDLGRAIQNTNIFIATPIAQCAIESGYGTSPVARDCNNFKGIAYNATYSQGRCSGHTKWAKFASVYDCFRSYAYFVTNSTKYAKSLLQASPEDQLWEIVYAGYCTSRRVNGKTVIDGNQKAVADYYLKTCKSYLNAMQTIGVGGKVGTGGITLAQLSSSISNLQIT